MTPRELATAAEEIAERWPDALIYPNACCDSRNPGVPDNALAVDVDRAWAHDCEGDDDCTRCLGWHQLVAWIDILGQIHYTELARVGVGEWRCPNV